MATIDLTPRQGRALYRLLNHHVSGPALNGPLRGVTAELRKAFGIRDFSTESFAALPNPHPENRDRVLWLADTWDELTEILRERGELEGASA